MINYIKTLSHKVAFSQRINSVVKFMESPKDRKPNSEYKCSILSEMFTNKMPILLNSRGV